MIDASEGHSTEFAYQDIDDEKLRFFAAAREGCVRCIKAMIASGLVGVNAVCDSWGKYALDYTIQAFLQCPSTALDEVIHTLGSHCGRSMKWRLQAVPPKC
jgi:hypothetical protein